MKILFAQNIAAIAGSEKYFIQLLPALAKEGIEVSFFNFYLPKNKTLAKNFTKILEGHNIPVFECETKRYVSFNLLKTLNKCLIGNKIDILHSHLVYADFLGALLKFVFSAKVKLVSTLHGYQENLYFKYCLTPKKLPKTLYYWVMKFAFSQMDGVYACSYGLKNFFDSIGLKPKSSEIEVVHHGFDYPPLDKGKVQEFRIAEKQLVIVGRLIERKGHLLVFKEFKNIVNQFPEVILLIAGDGEMEDDLKKFVWENQLSENIIFLGYKEDTLELMAASDVVLVPSYSEGLPLVIFEAFHSETPVVAFDTIGCNEAVKNNVTGLIAKAFDSIDFIKKVKELLFSKERSKSISEAAKKSLGFDFSKNKMVDKTIDFYKSNLSS